MNPTNERKPDGTADQNHEVELAEVLAVVWRYRWLILGACLSFLLAAAVYLALASPVYESQAVIKVGLISDRKEPIEVPADLIARLKLEHDLAGARKGRKPGEARIKTIAQFETPNYVEITAEGPQGKLAQQEANAAALQVVKEHAERQATVIQRLEAYVAKLNALHATLQNHRSKTVGELNANEGGKGGPSLAAIIAMEGVSLDERLVELQELIVQQELALALLRDFPTRVHFEAQVPGDPVHPLPLLTLILALFLGLASGGLAVFAREFWVHNRQRFQR